jgi:hypothetical protein
MLDRSLLAMEHRSTERPAAMSVSLAAWFSLTFIRSYVVHQYLYAHHHEPSVASFQLNVRNHGTPAAYNGRNKRRPTTYKIEPR